MEWFYADANGAQAGPVSPEELKRLARLGVINRQTLIWQSAWSDWRPAEIVSELFPAPPPLPNRPPPIPQPTHARKHFEPVVPEPKPEARPAVLPTVDRPSEVNKAAVVAILIPILTVFLTVLGAVTSNDSGPDMSEGAAVLVLLCFLGFLATAIGQFAGSFGALTDKGWSQGVLVSSSLVQGIVYVLLLLLSIALRLRGSLPEVLLVIGGNGFIIKSMLSKPANAWFKNLKQKEAP